MAPTLGAWTDKPPGLGVRQPSLSITHIFFLMLGRFCLVLFRLMYFIGGCINQKHPATFVPTLQRRGR